MRRLPSRIDFGIAVIYIKQVSIAEMKDVAECEDDEVVPDGLWDSGTDTIYLLKKLSHRSKREVFFHELVHAAVDNNYWARHGV